MYELSRVHLHSIGPGAARFEDITLDLRGYGTPLPAPDEDLPLFGLLGDMHPEAVAHDRALTRRCSPATVLHAINGGGKTTLMQIIFSVLIPSRRARVGNEARDIEGLVLAKDVAHAVIEWADHNTGARLITGHVMAWKDGTVSEDKSRLQRAWYAFKPATGFGFDDLPFSEDNRRVQMPGFKARLETAHDEYGLDLKWTVFQNQWVEALDRLGLDSVLFEYQRRMNEREAGADETIKFKTDSEFADWMLKMAIDRESLTEMVDSIDSYAAQYAERDTILGEHTFVEGALEHLAPLAQAAEDLTAADRLREEEETRAHVFSSQVHYSTVQAQSREDVLAEQKGTIDERVTLRRRANERAQAAVRRLRWEAANLRAHAAARDEEQCKGDRDQANTVVEAWAAVPVALRQQQTASAAEAIRGAIAAAEEQSVGPLRVRDQAATTYLAALQATIADLEETAERLDAAAEQAAEEASEADTQAGSLERQAAKHDHDASQAEGETQRARAALAAAIEEGWVPAGTGASQMRQVVDAAAEAAHSAEEAVGQAQDRARALNTERQAAQIAATQAQTNAGRARFAADRVSEQATAATALTAALEAEARLAQIQDTSNVDLRTDAERLIVDLHETIARTRTRVTALRVEDAADERVVESLTTGGLLPAVHAEKAREVLVAAGISCYTGWEYLARKPAEHREQIIDRHPALADGVLLNDPAHTARAREILGGARLLPDQVVVVSSTSAIEDLAPSLRVHDGLPFLIEPHPALYDLEKASAERERVQESQAQRREEIEALEQRLRGDQRLVEQVSSWHEQYGQGRLDALLASAQTAVEAAHAAADEAQEKQEVVAEIEGMIGELAEQQHALTLAARHARDLSNRVSALGVAVDAMADLTESAATHRRAQAQDEKNASELRAHAKQLREGIRETDREADSHRRTMAAHQHTIGTINGAGDPTEVDPQTYVGLSLAGLASAYAEADAAYQAVQVGEELTNARARAEDEESRARQAWESLPAERRARAQELLTSVDGGDDASRAAARARAERAYAVAVDRYEKALAAHVGAKAALENETRDDASLDPYGGTPLTVQDAEAALETALVDQASTLGEYNAALGEQHEFEQQATQITSDVKALRALLRSVRAWTIGELEHADRVDLDVVRWQGSVADAETRYEEIAGNLTYALTEHSNALGAARRAASVLNRFVTGTRFEHVETAVRTQMLNVDVDDLHAHAVSWQQSLRTRHAVLSQDIANIERYRNANIATLRRAVESAESLLRNAERDSVLPEAMESWGGHKFLKITYTKISRDLVDHKIGEVLDRAVAGTGSRKRDGLSLVLDGLHALLGDDIKVEILKPDMVLTLERHRVSKIKFSGGQYLTTAIILYCTMARLRANNRGIERQSHPRTLFLDNPFGSANATYLLELQIAVAEAWGVQLVFTTGIEDMHSLNPFSLVIRLANDMDQTSGRKYLRVKDDPIARHLYSLPDPGESGQRRGTVTSARVGKRPVASSAQTTDPALTSAPDPDESTG